jgi:hypothetical protein
MVYILIVDIGILIKCSIGEFLGFGLDEWPKTVSDFPCRAIVGQIGFLYLKRDRF